VVFAGAPMVRVRGPVLQAQLVETALLAHVGFPTLVATKAARLCEAAAGDEVLEFGLRRAQGPDGGLTASRAAYVGGCAATSNVLAGRRFGVPVRGTHAHSWVLAFDSEPEAFAAYADALPNNCVFLVDTYDTLDGVRNAAAPASGCARAATGCSACASTRRPRLPERRGAPPARRGRLPRRRVLASNDLDERLVASLKAQGAPIAVWGVGTRLVTAHDQPALGCVYKLTAMRDAAADGGAWRPRVKVSEQAAKTTTPGVLQVRRYRDAAGRLVGDMILDELTPPDVGADALMIDPLDPTRRKRFGAAAAYEALLAPVFRGGARVRPTVALDAARGRARAGLAALHPGVRRFDNPHRYPVGLERGLYDRRTALVLATRGEEVGID
jgi:nicotinate phosphoribosyltransferase